MQCLQFVHSQQGNEARLEMASKQITQSIALSTFDFLALVFFVAVFFGAARRRLLMLERCLLLMLLLLLLDSCVAHEARFPRNVMPTECNDGQLPRDADVQRCLRALNGNVALAFDCKHMSELVFNDASPFASGLWKEAYRGTWRAREVVVKRNRQRTSSGRRSVVFEAIRMILLRAPSHVELLGHCSQDDDVSLNLVPLVLSWGGVLNDSPMPALSRVDVALRIVDMIRWWRDSPFGPLVHCDLLPEQIGFSCRSFAGAARFGRPRSSSVQQRSSLVSRRALRCVWTALFQGQAARRRRSPRAARGRLSVGQSMSLVWQRVQCVDRVPCAVWPAASRQAGDSPRLAEPVHRRRAVAATVARAAER
jgi:hypothetical protein